MAALDLVSTLAREIWEGRGGEGREGRERGEETLESTVEPAW